MIYSIFSLNLSNNQWKDIRLLLQHPKTTIAMREHIRQIIFTKYRTWTIHQAYIFKRYHRYKCRNINIEDLTLYSLEGLQIAVNKYNGSSYFHTYANQYILWKLYEGLTDLQPITIISKSIRKRSNKPIKNRNQYKKLLNSQFIGFDHYWMFEKNQERKSLKKERNVEELWEKIELDIFSKRVFQYKYDIFFNKIRSNKEISELMCCSEETIRMNIKKTREKLKISHPNIIRHDNS
jgi:RNA polymerase sigma factor (sigma-70 family)